MTKTAVVLFNLGGPSSPDTVQPFLFNLFNDRAIIGLPQPLRWLLAKIIARRRAPTARGIYANLGGASPLLPNTLAQSQALEAALSERGNTKVFIAMRYWHPMSMETAQAVKAYAPDRILLLPLYPQFSTTTTGSSAAEWARAAAAAGLEVPTTTVCCYPTERGFVETVVERLRPALRQARAAGDSRVLFSAHGLPKKIVARGDPYQWQVEETVRAVVAALDEPALDWQICYQSRVGPLEWIGPSTEDEIARAGRDGVALVVVPIAFVSEHSETLVELDIEYAHLAEEKGVPAYIRVHTVADGPAFIAGLTRLVEEAVAAGPGVRSLGGGRLCPLDRRRCAQAGAAS